MYNTLIKKLLFCLPPETAHDVTLKLLSCAQSLKLTNLLPKSSYSPKKIMGLTFPNIIGLAAGLDKNGDYIDALASLGFGFIEVGTITPKPQSGNDQPRLFRLVEEEAIINRMGFNNKGVDYLVGRLKNTHYKGILGINIGKNKTTPIENAVDDYLYSLRLVIPFASYITINVSSPNTENLRQLQHGELLQNLLRTLKAEQAHYYKNTQKYVPLLVKISPDLTAEELSQMCAIFLAEHIDGVIATNTTLDRKGVESSIHAQESGGLSGKPVMKRSTDTIKQLHAILGDNIPIIGCGGISSAEDAKEKILAGASLLQIYTGFIYQGPKLIRDIAEIG